MVQARYIISNKVIGVGLRIFITSFMMDSGFKKGVAKNIDEETVEVLIDLEHTDTEEFRKSLEIAIHTGFKSEDPKCIPEKIKVELTKTNNPGWDIPELMFSSQSLLLSQTGKGVNVMIQIREAIKELPNKLADAIKGK